MCVPQFFYAWQNVSETHTHICTYRRKHTVYIWHGCCNLSSASDPQSWLSAMACWPTNQSTAQSQPQAQLQTSSTTSFAIYNNYSLYPSRPRPLSNALFGPRNIGIERERTTSLGPLGEDSKSLRGLFSTPPQKFLFYGTCLQPRT